MQRWKQCCGCNLKSSNWKAVFKSWSKKQPQKPWKQPKKHRILFRKLEKLLEKPRNHFESHESLAYKTAVQKFEKQGPKNRKLFPEALNQNKNKNMCRKKWTCLSFSSPLWYYIKTCPEKSYRLSFLAPVYSSCDWSIRSEFG